MQDIGIEVKFVLNVSNDSSANTDGCSRKALPHLDCHCEYLRHDDVSPPSKNNLFHYIANSLVLAPCGERASERFCNEDRGSVFNLY